MNVFFYICDSSRPWSYKTARDVGVRRLKNQWWDNSQIKDGSNLPTCQPAWLASQRHREQYVRTIQARPQACMNFEESVQKKRMEIILSKER